MYELAQGNRIEYAYLGITMTTITPNFAHANNLDPNSHQLIPEVIYPSTTTIRAFAVSCDDGSRKA